MTDEASGQRKVRRYAVDVEASVRLPDSRVLKARTRDLSRNGICLVGNEALTVGAVVGIELVLSFGNNAYSEPLNLTSRVVWSTHLAGNYQVGAMFEDVSDQQDQFLEMFLHYLDGTLSPRGMGEDEDAFADPGHPDEDDPFR